MKLWVKAVAGGCLLLGTAVAAAEDCNRAGSPIDKTICVDAALHRLDDDLNRLYVGLRSNLTAKARAALLAQQRAWLAKRNRDCAAGAAACLHEHYGARLDQLEALSATAEAVDGSLDDVTPVMVTGSWRATAVQDPAGAAHPDEAALRRALSRANLPELGATVNAAPGKLCSPPLPCDSIGWTRQTLAEVAGARAIGRYLGLSPTVRVLDGGDGAKWGSHYLLVPRSDGTLWAVFSLCGPVESDCRYAAELWMPATPEAKVWPPL